MQREAGGLQGLQEPQLDGGEAALEMMPPGVLREGLQDALCCLRAQRRGSRAFILS